MFTCTITLDPDERRPYAPWAYLLTLPNGHEYAGHGNTPAQALERAGEAIGGIMLAPDAIDPNA